MSRRLLVSLTALLLFAGACGSDPAEEVQAEDREPGTSGEDASDAGQVPADVNSAYLAQVASETLGNESGRFEMTMSYAGQLEGSALDATMTATGSYDESVPAAEVTVDMGGFMQGVADAAAAAGEDTSGIDELLGDDFTVETVQVGTMTYLRMPMLGALGGMLGLGEDAADKWIAVDIADMGGDELTDLGGTSGMDGEMYLELLQGAYGDVEDLGTVDVRGTETTGYRVLVSVDEALAAQTDDEAMAELESQLEGMGAAELAGLEIPVEVYLDADEQVRRVAVSLDIAEMAPLVSDLGVGELGDGSFTMDMSIDFFDLGAPVDIQAPPADETVDLESMFGDLGSMLGDHGLEGDEGEGEDNPTS